ncbi:MAG: hypothetical protein IKD55_07525 [Sediminibacterium sp.]|jgi:hypothetical protein|nr:hypothetical protein [Sediminibacterium sp.]MBX9780454.1 hypothetical protein [Chitinophagaceae bacterium]
MKKLCVMVAALFLNIASFSQQTDWKEMHAFHSVMSKTFHPAEGGNLKPVKENAIELVTKAKSWQLSKAPVGYNEKVTSPILKQLVEKCNAIDAAVKAKKSDKELTKLITEAHDIFHEIMEKCKVGEKH